MNLFLKNWIDLLVSCNGTATTVLLNPIWNKPNTAIRRSLQRNFWGVVFKYVCEICSWSNENTWSMLVENVRIYRLYIIHKLQNSDPILVYWQRVYWQFIFTGSWVFFRVLLVAKLEKYFFLEPATQFTNNLNWTLIIRLTPRTLNMNVLITFILGHLSNMNFSKNFELERNTVQVLSKVSVTIFSVICMLLS